MHYKTLFLLVLFLVASIGTATAEEDQLNALERVWVNYQYDNRIGDLNGSIQPAADIAISDLVELPGASDVLVSEVYADVSVTNRDNDIIISDNSNYKYLYDVAIPYADVEKFVVNGQVYMRHYTETTSGDDAAWYQNVNNVDGYAVFEDIPFSTVTVGYSYLTISADKSANAGYQNQAVIQWKTGMNSDFSNIRFYANQTSYRGGTEIPYYVDLYTASTSAIVWLPFPADCTTVYCEWGIDGETASESDGKKVFPLLFDNFSSKNTTVWGWEGGSSALVSDGILNFTTKNTNEQVYSKDTFGTNITIMAKVKTGHAGGVVSSCYERPIGWNYSSYEMYMGVTDGASPAPRLSNCNVESTTVSLTGTWSADTWYVVNYTRTSTPSTFFQFSGGTTTNSNNVYTNNSNIRFRSISMSSSVTSAVFCDWIAIRQYMASPPTITVGSSVASVPVADFVVNTTNGTTPLTVQFNDTSTNSPTNWSWDFGDGTNVAGTGCQNVTHTYTESGVYDVVLRVENAAGYSTDTENQLVSVWHVWNNQTDITWAGIDWTIRDNITVGEPGTLPWSSDNTSVYVDGSNQLHMKLREFDNSWYGVELDDLSSHRYGNYSWTVSSTSLNMTNNVVLGLKLYDTDEVELGIENSQYGNSTGDVLWFVNEPAGEDSNYSSVTYDSSDRLAVDVMYKIVWRPTYIHYTASRSNGSTLADWNYTSPTYVPLIGNATVSMNLWLFSGATPLDNTTQEVVLSAYSYNEWIQDYPIAAFTASPTSGNAPLTVQFTDTSTKNPISWYWDFGDGGTSVSQNPSHTYGSVGTYTVTLTVTNVDGSAVETKTNYIQLAQITTTTRASFATSTIPGSNTITFYDSSVGSIQSYTWNFGDGNTSTEQSPSHTYIAGGVYPVTLTVQDSTGNYTTQTTPVSVGDVSESNQTPENYSQYSGKLITNNMTLWTFLQNASSTYTSFIPENLFYLIIIIIMFIPLYIRTGSVLLPCVIYLFIGGFIAIYMPSYFSTIALWLTVLAAAGIIYKLFIED